MQQMNLVHFGMLEVNCLDIRDATDGTHCPFSAGVRICGGRGPVGNGAPALMKLITTFPREHQDISAFRLRHRREQSKVAKFTTNDFRPADEVPTGCVGWGVAL
jgi:hypothetical protein